jgi:hypothetical protein
MVAPNERDWVIGRAVGVADEVLQEDEGRPLHSSIQTWYNDQWNLLVIHS